MEMEEEYQRAVALRLESVRTRVAAAAANRQHRIRIVGVSKTHPPEKVAAAILEGMTEIGENRVQEAAEKKPLVERLLAAKGFDPDRVRWHMVGRLQSNKAGKAAALFDVIQSVDSVKLARRLDAAANELGKLLEVLIEVNCSGEATKGGIDPAGLEELALEAVSLNNTRLSGLMTVGPLTVDHPRIQASFETLGSLKESLERSHPGLTGGWELSMGMSDDFELAVAAGATMLRLGTVIFGPRSV